MIRILNFTCVALMGLTILGLYHVSERTRVARVELGQVEHRISDEHAKMSVLQAQWEQLARPDRIQRLAQSSLGMDDTATVQLSSLTLLPRRGDEAVDGVRTANAQMPATQPVPLVKISARGGM